MKKDSNIVILTTGLTRGGAERQLSYLAVHLSKIGKNVKVLPMISAGTFNAYDYIYQNSDVKILETSFIKKRLNIKICIRTLLMLIEYKPTTIISFNYPANMLGRFYKLLNPNVLLITSVRNIWNGGVIRDLIFKWTKSIDNLTIFNSQNVYDHFVITKLVIDIKSKVILNGVDLSKFEKNVNSPLSSKYFSWLSIGRMEDQKDFKTLILAFKSLSTKYPNAILSIYGDGPLRLELIRFIKFHNLEDHVELKGTTNDVANVLKQGNALVLSSKWEGLPNVIIEAIASGKPVVSSNVGGVNELVKDGFNGFLCEPGNSQQLFQKMSNLMDLNTLLYEQFCINSLNHAKNFELNSIMSKWVREIEDIADIEIYGM
jgi:glycosyltransferase involved in cell wall biosynthesis